MLWFRLRRAIAICADTSRVSGSSLCAWRTARAWTKGCGADLRTGLQVQVFAPRTTFTVMSQQPALGGQRRVGVRGPVRVRKWSCAVSLSPPCPLYDRYHDPLPSPAAPAGMHPSRRQHIAPQPRPRIPSVSTHFLGSDRLPLQGRRSQRPA